MINTIGAMVGAKVTDKKQTKGRLFLKFDNDLEEKKDMTAISSWKKKIKKVKGLTKTQLQVLRIYLHQLLLHLSIKLVWQQGDELYKKILQLIQAQENRQRN